MSSLVHRKRLNHLITFKKNNDIGICIIFPIICVLHCTIAWSQSLPESIKRYEDSLVNILTIANNDSQKVDELFSLARKVYKHDYKKGFKYINQSIDLAERINFPTGQAKGHFLKGVIFYYTSNHDGSLEELFKALSINKSLKIDWLNASTNNWIGNNYSRLDNIEESKKYYEKSLASYMAMGDQSGIAMLNNNIGLLLYNQQKFDSALEYYEKALSNYTKRPNSIANTTLNIILIHLKKGELDLAGQKISYVDSFIPEIDNFLVLTEYYYIKGLWFNALKENSKAVHYFQKSIDLGTHKKFWKFVELSSLELSDIYLNLQNHKKSLQYYKNFTQAKDSVVNIETRKKIKQLEIQNSQDKYLTELKLIQQQKRMQYVTYLFIAFCTCSLLAFLYYLQRKKIKQRKKDYELQIQTFESELQNSSQEKTQLEYELIFKNNELTNFALQIIQNDEFIKRIRQKIKLIVSKLKKDENLKSVEELDLFVRQSMNLDKSRKEFYARTKSLHKTFLYLLKERFPNLSAKEIELSLLLRLGYSSKEIAALLNISSKSVDMARYRLRKKINVDSTTSLTDFFNSFDS